MARLQILMLTPQMPYPPHQGTSLRNLHVLRALAENHEVTLLSFHESDKPPQLEPLRAYCHVLTPVPITSRSTSQRLAQLISTSEPDLGLRLRSEAFSAALSTALAEKRFDAIQIEGMELAYVIEQIKREAPGARVVIDCHNAETELQRRALQADIRRPKRWPTALYSAIQIGRLEKYERQALLAADGILAVSEIDRQFLRQTAPQLQQEITVAPNTIDVSVYASPEAISGEQGFDLVFTGKMDYRPNVDGVLWFADFVWPRIIRERPQTTWAIVGQRPAPSIQALRGTQGITVTGSVPDIRPYIAGATVFIMPLRMGSGTRLKLIEGMAAGKPVVSTRLGAEGFPVQDGVNIILADIPEQQSEAILHLLREPELRGRLSSAAYELARQYDWRQIVPLLADFYDSLVRRK
jgi:glycosyltransferase involved in cell wall biosynthesis